METLIPFKWGPSCLGCVCFEGVWAEVVGEMEWNAGYRAVGHGEGLLKRREPVGAGLGNEGLRDVFRRKVTRCRHFRQPKYC